MPHALSVAILNERKPLVSHLCLIEVLTGQWWRRRGGNSRYWTVVEEAGWQQQQRLPDRRAVIKFMPLIVHAHLPLHTILAHVLMLT